MMIIPFTTRILYSKIGIWLPVLLLAAKGVSQTTGGAVAKQPFQLFSINHRAAPQFHNDILAPHENRASVAFLNRNDASDIIDLSGELLITLFEDVQYSAKLERVSGQFLDGLEVWSGRVPDSRFDHLQHYKNVIAVVNRKTSKLVLSLSTERGYFQILPTEGEGAYRIRDCKDEPFHCELLMTPESLRESTPGKVLERSTCGNACYNETDTNGKYVIDIFIGFSNSAASVAGDINAYAQTMVSSVNNGLSNSLVSSTYLRLVGTGTTANNPGVISSVLSDCYTWFSNEINTYNPDLISVFQTLTGASGEAGGWAGIGGGSNVNNVGQPDAFRHEIGHNAGGGHCSGDGSSSYGSISYGFGYNNGNWSTHMCGNSVNFYSTPNVNDNLGNPIGNATTADMARLWNERAADMAKRRQHKVAFFAGDPCTNIVCLPDHWGSQNELIKRVVLHTLDNNQSPSSWTCNTTTGFSDYSSLQTTLTANSTYTLAITPNYSWNDSKVGVWIDWDKNNEFSGGEQVGNFSGVGPWSTNVTVPSTFSSGSALMRIRLQYGSSYVPEPCEGSNYSGGETEDYTILAAPLPVELLSFEGRVVQCSVELQWFTVSEIQNMGFAIERSDDGLHFSSIGFVPGVGTSVEKQSYNFFDKTPFSPINYYRLRQINEDGSFEFSKIIAVSFESDALVLFPNPTSDAIWIQGLENEPAKIVIMDMFGKVLHSFITETDHLQLSELPSGLYAIMVRGNGKILTTRLVKY